MQTHFSSLAQAVSSHAARACEKARTQNWVAHRVHVFVRSNPFHEDLKQYIKSIEYRLVNPTNDTRIITQIAKRCLKKLFKPRIFYKKVGVMLEELRPDNPRQQDLFNPVSSEEVAQSKHLMSVLDKINARFGSHTVRLASEGYSTVWHMRAEQRSPCYTTRWSELPCVH